MVMSLAVRFATYLMKWGNSNKRFGGQTCYTPSFIKPENDQTSMATKRAFPSLSYLGREVLPRLNGTTERDFKNLIRKSPFEIKEVTPIAFASRPGGRVKRMVNLACRAMLKLPMPFTRDIFISTIRCVLKKRET